MEDESSSPSLKHRLKNTIYACFKPNDHHQHHQLLPHFERDDSPPRTLSRSSSGGMLRHLINCVGNPHHHHRKSKSTDFGYDPQSYALNFDHEDDDNAAFLHNFTARLPPSPTAQPSGVISESPVARSSPREPSTTDITAIK